MCTAVLSLTSRCLVLGLVASPQVGALLKATQDRAAEAAKAAKAAEAAEAAAQTKSVAPGSLDLGSAPITPEDSRCVMCVRVHAPVRPSVCVWREKHTTHTPARAHTREKCARHPHGYILTAVLVTTD